LPSAPSLEEFQLLEEALHHPETRHSREALETLLAPDLLEFGASGSIYDRTTTIDLLTQKRGPDEGGLRTTNYTLRLIADDAVLLTYETERSYQGGLKRCVLRSSVWKHDGLRWQMFFHQGTVRS
jgi:hypothetical protein